MAAKKKTATDKTEPDSTRTIRDEAVKTLKESPVIPSELAGQDKERIIYELRIHQIELNMQAEELRRSHHELENSRDKFLDQYDFAPTGLLTINEKGSIVEVNLTCSKLLGVERSKLVRERFSTFVVPEDQDQWYWYITNVLQQEGKQYCTLLLKPAGGSSFPARLEAVRLGSGGINPEIRIAISDITEIRQAEDALKKSEEQYRLLTDNAVSAIAVHEIVLDRKGKPVDSVFRSANPAFKSNTGLRAEDVIGHRLSEIMPGMEKTPFIGICGKVVRTGESFTFEQYSEPLSRTYYVNAFKVGQGRFATVFTDITERKLAEVQLQESEEKYRILVEKAKEGIIIAQDGVFAFANGRMDEIFGVPAGDLVGRPFKDFIWPEDRELVISNYRKRISGEDVRETYDFRVINAEGRIIWVSISAALIQWKGKPATLNMLTDISQRKLAEEKLIESMTRFDELTEQNKTVVWEVDTKGLYTYVSHLSEAVWGYRPDELIGHLHFYDMHPKLGRKAFKAASFAVFERKEPFLNLENTIQIKDGHEVWVSTNGIPMLNADGTLRGYRGSDTDITQRKVAEEKLKQSEILLRSMIESPQSIIIFSLDRNFRYLAFNTAHLQTMKAIWGADIRPGMSMLEVIGVESDRKKAQLNFERALSGEHFILTEEYGHSAKSRKLFEDTYSPIYNENHTVIGLTVYSIDVTDRKNSEAALKDSEEKFRGIFDTVNDGIHIHEIGPDGKPGKFIDVNESACRMLQYTHDEMLKKGPLDMVSGDHSRPLPEILKELSSNGHSFFETEHRRKDGTMFPVEINAHVISLKGELRVVSVVRDITDRKRADEAIHESELKYRTLVDTTGTGFVIIDRQGRVLDANPEYVRLAGYTNVKEISGRNVNDWTAAYEKDKNAEAVRHCLRDGCIRNLEIDYMHTSGTIIPIEINATVLQSGDTVQILTLCRDITDRKRAEEALQKAHDTLETTVKRRTADLYLANMQLQKEIEDRKVIAESLKEYAKMTSILNEVILTANKTESLPELFRDTLDKTLELLDFEAGGIYLVNPAEKTAEIHYTKNLPDDFVEKLRKVPIEATPYDTLFVRNQPIITENYDEMSPEEAQKYNIRSLASIPLVSKNTVIGALNVTSSKRYTVSADEKQVLITIGRELGTIVERLRAEEAFKKASENLQVLFDSVNEMIFVLDMQGRIFKVNKTVERKLGYTDEELHNTDVLLLHVPDRRDEALMNVQGMIAGNIDSCPVPLIAKNKKIIEVETKVTRGRWDGNEVLIGVSRDVTERKVAEDEIQRQASLIKSLLDSIPDIIFFKDREGVYLGCNPPFAEFVGKPREDIIGKTDYELFDKEIADFFRDYDNRMLELGEPSQNEEEITYPDGRKKQIDTLKTPYRGPDGSLIGVLGISRDITRRKAAEEALLQSEKKYRRIIENSHDIIYTLTQEGIFTFVSPSWTRLLGHQVDQVVGQPFKQFVHPDDLPRCMAFLQLVLTTGSDPGEVEYRVKHVDGDWYWHSSSALPAEYEAGRFVSFYGIARDITGRKQAEEKLHELSDRLSLAVRAGGVGIWDYDVVNNTLTWDDQMFSLYGITRQQFGGAYEAWQSGLHPDDRTRGDEEIQKALSGEKEFNTEFRVLWPDGTIRNIRALAVVHRDAAGKPLRLIGTNWDITDQKNAEKALQENDILLRLILSLSARFINISSDKIYYEISTAIGELGRFAGVDRSYVFLLSDDGMSMHNTHEWCAEAIAPQKDALQDLSTELFPWWMERLHRFETIHVPRVAELPEEAGSEKEILEGQDIKSVLIVPLISQNQLIGFLGFDSVRNEKTWPENIITLVTITGKSISNAIERERAEEALRKSEFFLKETQQIARLGGWKANPHTNFLEWTDGVYDIIQAPRNYRPGLIEGMKYYAPEDIPVIREKMAACLLKGEPFDIEVRIITETGKTVWTELRGLAPVIEGTRSYVMGTLQDITERKRQAEEIAASLLEKETLLKEIHHRVKNNMQVISSLLLLQRKQISDPKTRTLFQESENRIFSIALVHEKLYRSKSLSNVDVQDYLRMMGDYLFTSFDIGPGRLALDIKAEGVFLPIDKAIPLSLITNELLTNSLKHAFPDKRKGSIQISMTREKGSYRYIFHDDGIGFPAHIDFHNTESLGMQLVNGLVGQILGTVTLTREKGTTFEIVFTIVNDTEDHHEQGNHTDC